MTTNREFLYSLGPSELNMWFDAEHVDADDANANLGTDRGTSEVEPSTVAEVDSREKLEADALDFANGFIRKHGGAISWNDELYRGIIALLDHQAAITERETGLRELYRFGENHREHIRSIEEVNQVLNGRIAELTAERDNLARDLAESERLRERFRNSLSNALYHASEITRQAELA